VLYREPKLLKVSRPLRGAQHHNTVSVLYREPKLLKATNLYKVLASLYGFSALP